MKTTDTSGYKSVKPNSKNRMTSSGHKGNEAMDWKTDLTNDKHSDQKQKKEQSGSKSGKHS